MIPSGGMPGIFPGQWGGESRQRHLHSPPQHQSSHLNAIQIQQEMIMRHPHHHSGQPQMGMPGVSGGIAGGQLMSYHGHSAMENPAAAQAQAAMMMNHRGMSNPLCQFSVSGGGGMATSTGGAMVPNGMHTAESFAGKHQQFQQQAGFGALRQSGCQHQSSGKMNPMIGGNAGEKIAASGGNFDTQSHQQQQQQAQVARYWNAVRASSVGNQNHGHQETDRAQEHGMEQVPKQSAMGGMNPHHQPQVELQTQLQQPQPQQLGGGGGNTAQLQDPQTLLLLQQQNLIAQLQRQLQQQEQRGQQQPQLGSINPGSMPQDRMHSFLPSSNNAIQQPQQIGGIGFSSSIQGMQAQHLSYSSLNIPNRLHLPLGIQENMQGNANTSFGSQMGHHNNLEQSMHAQQQQMRQMANISVNDSNMPGVFIPRKSDQCHEIIVNNSNHLMNHQSSTGMLNTTLIEPMIPGDVRLRAESVTRVAKEATKAQSRTSSAAGSALADDASAGTQQRNQQILSEAMSRRVSETSLIQQQRNALKAGASQALAQDPQQKHQRLSMTQLVQPQLGTKDSPALLAKKLPFAMNSPASLTRDLPFATNSLGGDGHGEVAVSVGEPSGSAAVGSSDKAELEQRIKYQVVQNSKQSQDQKQVFDVGFDFVVGGNQQQSQGQQQLAYIQSHQAQQQHFVCHDQGLPNVVVVSGLAQSKRNKQVNTNESESAPTASDDSDSTVASLPNELLSFNWNVGNKSSILRRGSQDIDSLSQGSLSQGSISQGSFGIVDPNPIADGFNTALGCAALIGSTTAGGEGNCGGKSGQQNFLDGHFAGGWQSNADLPDRRRINFHIIKVIERMRPDANRMSQNRLPLMAKKLEEHLYRSLPTKEEYVDLVSLKRRLHLIAKGVGIAKLDEGDDIGDWGDDSSSGGRGDATGSVMSGQIGGGQASGVPVDLNVSNNQALASCRKSSNQHVQQFEQQQLMLQSEIQRQVCLIQRQSQSNKQQPPTFAGVHDNDKNRSNGQANFVSSVSGGTAARTKPSKRSVDINESAEARPSKLIKHFYESKGVETSDKSSRSVSESSGSLPDDGRIALCDLAARDVASSLSASMCVPDIEQNRDSLMSSGQMTPGFITRKCLPLTKKLINHEHGWVFKDAVDPVELGIPDYFDIVKHPMDLTLVANNLENGAYKDMASFEHDIKLVFDNAILFNGDDSDVGLMAQELLDTLAAEIKTLKNEAEKEWKLAISGVGSNGRGVR